MQRATPFSKPPSSSANGCQALSLIERHRHRPQGHSRHRVGLGPRINRNRSGLLPQAVLHHHVAKLLNLPQPVLRHQVRSLLGLRRPGLRRKALHNRVFSRPICRLLRHHRVVHHLHLDLLGFRLVLRLRSVRRDHFLHLPITRARRQPVSQKRLRTHRRTRSHCQVGYQSLRLRPSRPDLPAHPQLPNRPSHSRRPKTMSFA